MSSDSPTPFWRGRGGLVLFGFLAVAGYFLVTEHGAHVIPFLPWLLLLACPLMHMFMHGGHEGHDEHSGHGGSDTPPHDHDKTTRESRP